MLLGTFQKINNIKIIKRTIKILISKFIINNLKKTKMVQLKKKVTLKRKEAVGIFDFKKIIITLNWKCKIIDGELGPDFDLMAFYKTKDGKTGGVCSNEYNSRKSDLGFLDKFPFMQLSGDDKPDENMKEGDPMDEEMKIAKLDDFDAVYICVINYDDAVEGNEEVFGKYGGDVTVTTDSGDNFEVPMDSMEEGHVALICKIDNTTGNPRLINENKILSLGEFAETIPGAELVVKM
jgi:uncharacterized protein involved in tellurium resistance